MLLYVKKIEGSGIAKECSKCTSTCLEHYTENHDRVLSGFDDHKIHFLKLKEATKAWEFIAHIDEQPLEDTTITPPNCMALSPDGHNVAV